MTFFTEEELTASVRPADFLIEGVLERGVLAMLFGKPEAGKSFVAMDMAWSIAAGDDWFGRPVKQGPVFYIGGEGHSGFARRLAAWRKHHNIERPLPIHMSKGATDFRNPDEMHKLKLSMADRSLSAQLIVVDTMARMTPGMNEDRADEVMDFISACDGLRTLWNCTLLILQHSGHGDASRAKGSISLRGAVDAEYGLQSTSTHGVIRLECTKMKDGTKPNDQFMRFIDVEIGEGITSAVLTECSEPPSRAGKAPKFKPSANDLLFATALGNEPKDEALVRAAFIAEHPKRGDPAKNYRRTRERLLDRGWFTVEGHKLIPNPSAMERDGATGQ